MKKYWIILAAVFIAMILKDPCIGPFIGLMVGLVVGIPVYLLLCWILNLILRKHKTAEIASRCITIGLIVIFFWLVYHPPATILFKRLITKPIPASVSNLKGASCVIGPDSSHYLKFNIHKNDIEKIIQLKHFDLTTIEVSQLKDHISLCFITTKGSFSINLNGPSWFNLENLTEPKAFFIEGEYQIEYLLFDPNTSTAIYACLYF